MSISDERQLWNAVILLAIEDATYALGKSRQRDLEILRARDWLTNPSRDFAEVCSLAGQEPDRIRAQARRLIAEVVPHDCPVPLSPRKTRKAPTTTPHIEGQEANADS